MEEQLHRTHAHQYDDPGTHVYEEDESKSSMKKVKAKVDKLKEKIMHGHGHGHRVGEVHKDEAHTVNDSSLVKSGLVEPTVMGTPVLVEDLYTSHSDILDPPVRTFAQWEEEEKHGDPPPLSTAYGIGTHQSRVGHYDYGQDVNKKHPKADLGHGENENKGQLRGSIGKSTGMEEDPNAPNSTTPANYQSKVTDPTNTGGKEAAGITDVLRSFDKMKVYDEPDKKSSKSHQNEPKVNTGSHEQFAPEPVENPPLDTIADDPSNPNSSYKQRISSATSAITDKASALKDSIASKFSSSDENTHKTNTKSSSPTVYAHMVAETLSGTLGPVYEKVVDAGSSVMTKMQGSGQHDSGTEAEKAPESKGVAVKEYLVNTFKPGDDDKVLSGVIMHALHREKANEQPLETISTTTTYVIKDEGERRLQDSGN